VKEIEPVAAAAASLLACDSLADGKESPLTRLAAIVDERLSGHPGLQAALQHARAQPENSARVGELAQALAALSQADLAFGRQLAAVISHAQRTSAVGELVTQVYGHAQVGKLVTIGQAGEIHVHLSTEPAPVVLNDLSTTRQGLLTLPPRNPAAGEGSDHAAGRPFMVPASQKVFVPRPGLADPLIEMLNRPEPSTVAVAAALRGTGGFGKTTLAEIVCRDERITERFPGGVLWADVGRVTESRLAGTINTLIRAVGDDRPLLLDPDQAGARLAEVLGGVPTLLVVDDVWTQGQLRPFLAVGEECVRLVTTRNAQIVQPQTSTILVEAMEPDEARSLLLAGAGAAPEGIVERLLAITGRWPMLLALVNGAACRLMEQGNAAGDALAAVESLLRDAGPQALDLRHQGERSQAVQATMQVSLEYLAEGGREADVERYLELAVFPEGDDIPIPVLERLWQATGGLTSAEVRRLCMDLADMSLVLRYQLSPPRLRLHEVIRDYLRFRVGRARLEQLSETLLRLET
jgi:hypothetical protein